VLLNEPWVPATVGTEYVVGRVVEFDQFRVREQPPVTRPLLVADKDALAAAYDQERKPKLGKRIPV
jgi:hypothetical protein